MNSARYRYRLRFSKTGAARFVGHLDLQTLFQRAFKRANLPLAYSSGFNPHSLVSFAMPLPLGYVGLCEVVEVELVSPISGEDIIHAVNAAMPGGIKISSAALLGEGEKSAAALLQRAGWFIITPFSGRELSSAISAIKAQESVIVDIVKKNETHREDIRADIADIYVDESNERAVCAVLSAGGARNIKPTAVCSAICAQMGAVFSAKDFIISRAQLFGAGGEAL